MKTEGSSEEQGIPLPQPLPPGEGRKTFLPLEGEVRWGCPVVDTVGLLNVHQECMKELEETVMRHTRERLSEKRFGHVQRVVETIDEIAWTNGLSCSDCRLIGWLHDSAKQEPEEDFLDLVDRGEIDLDEETRANPKLWHGFHAAYWGRTQFGIDREDLLDAVRFHPTGSPGLTPEGIALYVADYAEPGRSMNGTEQIREQAKKSLYSAVLRVVDAKLAYIKGKGRTPHSRSLAFREWLLSLPEAQ